jgi:hypothetical protein
MSSLDYVIMLFPLLSGITFLAISKNENIIRKTTDKYGKDFGDLMPKVLKVCGYAQLVMCVIFTWVIFFL